MSKTFKYILDFQGNTSKIDGSISGVMSGLKGIAVAAGLAFGLKEAVDFGKEMANLSGVAEGVRSAFTKIASAKDLQNLKQSVHGTVSELELMKRAVSAQNLGIPVQELGSLFAFATKRAQDTGQEVDYLVNSIVTGIGRKSPLILDNLGISAIQLKEKLHGVALETASVADITRAVGEIAKESFEKTGDIIDTNAIKIQSLTAKWEDFKLKLAEDPGFNDWVGGSIQELDDIMTVMFSNNLSKWQKFKSFIELSGQNMAYFADKSREATEVFDEYAAMYAMARSAGNTIVPPPAVVNAFSNSIGALSDKLKQYNEDLKAIDPTNRAALQNKLAQINAIELEIKKIDKLKTAMAGLAEDTKAGFRDDAFSGMSSIGSAQVSGDPEDVITTTMKLNVDDLIKNMPVFTAAQEQMRQQMQATEEMQRALGDAFYQGFNDIGRSVIDGLGLAESGFEGFVGGLATTVIDLISMFMAQSLAASIAGATTSGAATGPAAIFTTPAFIATAIAGVMGAFAAIPMASGGIVSGPTHALVGEYPGASSNPEVVAPLSKLKSMLGGGNAQTLVLQPSIEYGYNGFRIRINQVEQEVYKRT